MNATPSTTVAAGRFALASVDGPQELTSKRHATCCRWWMANLQGWIWRGHDAAVAVFVDPFADRIAREGLLQFDDRQQDRPLRVARQYRGKIVVSHFLANSVRCFITFTTQFLLPIDRQYLQYEQIGIEVDLPNVERWQYRSLRTK